MVPLFSVEGNVCTFISSMAREDFRERFKVIFPAYARNVDSILRIVEAAKKQKHGTSIIISDKAEEEAVRLCEMKRAIRIQSYSFFNNGSSDKEQENIIKKFTSIDGALIISPDGVCFAIGVILDGKAVEKGDTGRGARYNSLNNYVTWAKKEDGIKATSMAIVISEDQTIDCLPKKDNIKESDTINQMTLKNSSQNTSHTEKSDEEKENDISILELLYPKEYN